MTTVFVQMTTGTVHRTPDCSVARRTRYGTEPVTLAGDVTAALDDGTYRWCLKCSTAAKPEEPR